MTWIVVGREKDKIKFVSKSSMEALLPKGYYITITEPEDSNVILRVEDSYQDFPYNPSPMIVDMDLSPLIQDQKCQNTILAYPIKDLKGRQDGLVNYIRPLSVARRANQDEINKAFDCDVNEKGPKIFLGTIQGTENKILMDESGNLLTASLPEDFFFHQTMICGKTGSGKTVSTKYLAQYFVDKMKGAVLAINVKDIDFLTMDKASNVVNDQILHEWEVLGEKARGVESTLIYYPSTINMKSNKEINRSICKPITLDVTTIDPTSLNGILQNISDLGAQYLPDIFRYWKEEYVPNKNDKDYFKFKNFVKWFADINRSKGDEKNLFPTKNMRGDLYDIPLHAGTASNILRNLNNSADYFDDENGRPIDGNDILQRGKVSIIDIQDERSKIFGSILLRQLLHHIEYLKTNNDSKIPVLVIIDEVHQFYNTESSKEALGDLDTICRQGRSQEIGVIFSSQNPSDIPRGLSSVINTKIFFKSDSAAVKSIGTSITETEFENLKKGFAIVSVHDRSQLKIVKFPLSFAGVYRRNE
ncbi:hypothetical protein MsAg5_16220 [Methanosarcinaceae archaeon Ag5]|uniref:AAA+ ATPase domain-containing protein n=1 Tax=Methanolapillus africanus TaxID=3028297 RepID=A0AAE4MKT9_9EURY|nr:hypothetical protein [Methanosarcinaceae archaeon Ag5]